MAKNSVSTIVDIAQALGVSPSTVSRALKDHPYISQVTKDKVKKMAVKLGYRRNTLAAGLRNRHSNTIGLIVPRISMYFQSSVITAIQNTVHHMGFNLIICQSNDSYALEVELVNALYGSRVEGLITSCTVHTTDFSHFNIFRDNGIPLVFYDRVPRNYPAQIVRGEDFQGGYKVGKYLLEKGCRDIACINGLLTCNLYQDRLSGLKTALREAGLPVKKTRIFSHELSLENSRKTFRRIFSRQPWPEAVFCANDSTAITVLQEARAMGISVPGQLRIVGYSNDPRSCIISPSITSVEQFPAEVGTRVASTIVELIRRKSPVRNPAEIVIPVELIERESS